MFPRKIKLCDLFGIPVFLDFSLIILLLLFTTGGGSLVSGLLAACFLLLSITAHELGHSLTARCFGYETSDITLSLLGGCASLIALPRKASQEFLTAIAGPAVSFLIAAAALTGVGLLTEGSMWNFILYEVTNGFFGDFDLRCAPKFFGLVDTLLDLGLMNLMLGLFNLLPGFPMDGGRVFRSAMRAFMDRARATYVAMIVGRVFAVLLALHALARIINHGSWGFVTLLIAAMIWKEGYREYQQALMEASWGGRWDYSARVSPPPYGGRWKETEVKKDR